MDYKYLVVRPNATFLLLYHHYVKEGWRRQYFYYDALKAEYKVLKHSSAFNSLEHFENLFYEEISRVFLFLQTTLKNIEEDLDVVSESCQSISSQQGQGGDDRYQAIELTLRGIYQNCKDCKLFFRLNKFAMNKMIKKYEKLISLYKQNINCVTLAECQSYRLIHSKSSSVDAKISELTTKTIELYGSYFRQTFEDMASDELEFVKNKSHVNRDTSGYLGFKLGMITCLVLWLIIQSMEPNLVENDFDFWESAGLYIYTTAGNIMLFRLTFAANVYIWSHYSINYIPLFGFHNIKSNLPYVINQTTTLLLIYFVNLMIYSRAYTSHTYLSRFPFFKYGCPLLLLVWTLCYEVYDFGYNGLSYSRGLFSRQVLINCFRAPMAILSFRDIYAADVLTSFTKVIADGVYSCCWLLSGAFLHEAKSNNFGSSYMDCSGKNMTIVVGCFQCLPMIIRLLQCFRQYYDSNYTVSFPFLYNALKYFLSIAVILYAIVAPNSKLSIPYLLLIVITTLYKWWWDCVMDWGLCDIMPTCNTEVKESASTSLLVDKAKRHKTTHYWFLRPLLMYQLPAAYYLCVVLDLILRFLWVVSLVPEDTFSFLMAPQLSFFMGSMEIIRRAMWGIFRLEYEHIKHVTKGTPGYLDHQHDLDRISGSIDGGRHMSVDNKLLPTSNEVTSMPENNDKYFKREGVLHRSKGLTKFVFVDENDEVA